MNKLIGLKIKNLYINSTKNTLRLETDYGTVDLNTVGDCCSQTWYEHISGVDNVKGGQITEEFNTRWAEQYSTKENREYDIDKYYSYVIKTDQGNLELEYRNNSNGYYGGWIEVDADQYGDLIVRQDSNYSADFKELTEDF